MATCEIDKIYELSDICLKNASANGQCFPKINQYLQDGAGVWCAMNACFGIVGNLLTLMSIPYAAYHKKFKFHKNWNTLTIFILNLALNDLLYCTISLPLAATQYFKGHEDNVPHKSCFNEGMFRYINAFSDWITLGVIAFGRCITLLHPSLSRKLNNWVFGTIMIVSIWTYPMLVLFPLYSEDKFNLGTMGYNCRSGKCDLISKPDSKWPTQLYFYSLGFTWPCLLILTSYIRIYVHIRSLRLQTRECLARQSDANRRDLKITWMIFLVCSCYFIFVLPITLVNMVDPYCYHLNYHLIAFCLYWMQYSLNFLVYVVSSKEYRKAYLLLIHQITCGYFKGYSGVQGFSSSK